MRLKIVIPIVVSISVAAVASGIHIIIPDVIVDNDIFKLTTSNIGPFGDINNQEPLICTLKNTISFVENYVSLSIKFYKENNLISGISSATLNFDKNEEKIITFSNISNKAKVADEIRFVITQYKDNSYVDLKEIVTPLKIYQIKQIDVNNLSEDIYNITDYSFHVENNKVITDNSTFNFYGLNNNFTSVNNYVFDFSSLYFSYSKEYRFLSSYIEFEEGIFKNLPSKIQLNLYQKENNIHFSLSNYYYYDPLTYELFCEDSSGLIKTDKLIIQKDKLSKFDGSKITFNIIGFGKEKTSINFSTHYYSFSFPIGECSNSDICVIGGVKK